MVVVRYPNLPTPVHMTEYMPTKPYHVDYMEMEKEKPQTKKNDNLCVDCMTCGGNILCETICNPWTWISYCFLDSLDGEFCNNWCCTS